MFGGGSPTGENLHRFPPTALRDMQLFSNLLRVSSLPNNPRRSPRRFPIPNRLLASLTPHENIYTLPNILTFSRLLSAPAVGYLILHDQHVIALSLFVYAGITDFIDGWIARKYSLQTVVGTVIDPMADKALMTVTTICLAVKVALPGELSCTA